MDEWLAQQEMGHYLPTRPKLRIYPSKRIIFQHPLFPNYTFGAFSLLQRNKVYGSEFAAGILDVADQARLLGELHQLRLALESGTQTEDCPFLAIGQKARITAGKLRGLEGLVLRRGKKTRLVLSVELLQRSVSVEIDPGMLEAAH